MRDDEELKKKGKLDQAAGKLKEAAETVVNQGEGHGQSSLRILACAKDRRNADAHARPRGRLRSPPSPTIARGIPGGR